jgi:hypothetical protein
VTRGRLRVLELEGTNLSLLGLDQLLADLPALTCLHTSAMEDYLTALQAALQDDVISPPLRLATALKSLGPAGWTPLSLQRLSVSIDRHGGGGARPSLLALIGRLFCRLTSLKLHHVHREEWRNLARLDSLQVQTISNYLYAFTVKL